VTIQSDGSISSTWAVRTWAPRPGHDRDGRGRNLRLEIGQVTIGLGDTQFPPSGGSGGSTTIGGVSVSTRKAAVNALGKIFDLLSPVLNVRPISSKRGRTYPANRNRTRA